MSVVALHQRMSEAEYEAERARLRATYGDSATEAKARREQALAALFYRSGWTQEELAAKEGKSPQHIARFVRFGRFLNFSPMGEKAETLPKNLSERRFRSYWEQTDGNERGRFVAVLELIKRDFALRSVNRAKIGPALVEQFADGKWHREQTIADHIEFPKEHVAATLQTMLSLRGTYGCKAEKKQVGTHFEWRLFRQTKMISSAELIEKLKPIVEGLEEQGRKNNATMSVVAVASLAKRLSILLSEWAE